MKKYWKCLLAISVLTGCGPIASEEKQAEDIVVYLSEYNARWLKIEDTSLYTAVESPILDAVNDRLQEMESGLHLTLKLYAEADKPSEEKNMINTIKVTDPDADIVPFSQYAVSEFFPLDDLWEEDLNTYYTEERLNTLRIHGKLMYFPKIIYPLVTPLVYVDEQYYAQHAAELQSVVHDPRSLLKYSHDHFAMRDDLILTDRIDFTSVVSDNYQNIPNTFLYIRKADGQVVDPYAEPALRETIALASDMRISGMTGLGMDPAAYERAASQMKFAITTTMAYDDGKDIDVYGRKQFKAGHDEYCYESGFSVLEDSDQKEDAYRLMHILLTDTKCSELLQYGIEPVRNASGKIVDDSHTRFGTWQPLGNNYLTESSEQEPEGKLQFYINKEKESDVHETNIYPAVFDLEDLNSDLSKLERIVSETGDDMDIHACLACTIKTENIPSTEEYMQKIDVLEGRLQEAGITDVIAALQEQVDAYEAGNA